MTRHGGAKGNRATPEYMAWSAMRQRCMNPKHAFYKNYGGRGIAIDPAWSEFATFLGDMGPRPSASHSLDRIDNNAGYSPENCRWATTTQQARNTTMVTLIGIGARRMCLADWEDATRLRRQKIRRLAVVVPSDLSLSDQTLVAIGKALRSGVPTPTAKEWEEYRRRAA